MPTGPVGVDDPLGVRIAAALIDLAVLSGLFVVVGVTIGEATVEGAEFSADNVSSGTFSVYLNDWVDLALFLALVFLYYMVLEVALGRTVGKLLLGLRVVRADGARPSVWAIAVRTLLRAVDWLPLLYLVGFVTTMATGARRQRLGDLAAKTHVPRASPMRHRGLTAGLLASSLVLVLAASVVYVAVSDEGDKTYRAHGVSFDYPAGWGEGRFQTLASSRGGGNELWSTAVGLGEIDIVSVTAYRLNISVTAQNLDSVMPELASLVQQLAEQLVGAVQGGPEQLTVAGLPGARFRITGTMQGAAIQETLVFAFDDTTEYYLNCQHTAEKTEEIERGCQQIVRTFTLQ